MALARFIEERGYQACPMLFMPFDVLAHVMAQLDPYDLCLVAQTCTVLRSPPPPPRGSFAQLCHILTPGRTRQTLNEVSSANCVWQRFGDSRWASSSSVAKGGAQWSWKGRYMTWLRPRLQTYAREQSTSCHRFPRSLPSSSSSPASSRVFRSTTSGAPTQSYAEHSTIRLPLQVRHHWRLRCVFTPPPMAKPTMSRAKLTMSALLLP